LVSEIGTGSFEVTESGVSDEVFLGGGTGEVCVPLLGLSEIWLFLGALSEVCKGILTLVMGVPELAGTLSGYV